MAAWLQFIPLRGYLSSTALCLPLNMPLALHLSLTAHHWPPTCPHLPCYLSLLSPTAPIRPHLSLPGPSAPHCPPAAPYPFSTCPPLSSLLPHHPARICWPLVSCQPLRSPWLAAGWLQEAYPPFFTHHDQPQSSPGLCWVRMGSAAWRMRESSPGQRHVYWGE